MKRAFERRYAPEPFEVREAADGTVAVSGYAAVYNQIAYGEVIRPGAFDKTYSENPDVTLLANHSGIPMARTKNYLGGEPTLKLDLRDKGLWFDSSGLDVSDNTTAREVTSAMRRGDMGECSFAFWPVIESRNDDGVRELLEVGLDGGDVSIVTNAWYNEAQATLNSVDQALLCLRSGKALTAEQRDTVTQWITVTLEVDDTDDVPVEDIETDDAPVAQESFGMNLTEMLARGWLTAAELARIERAA